MRVYTIDFDINIMKLNAEVIELETESSEVLDAEINRVLRASGYDYFDYSDEITILVDDNGLFKKGLPVFEIESMYGDIGRLAGRLLFVRNVENEFSTDIGSITDIDIVQLRNELKIQFIGFTKGVK